MMDEKQVARFMAKVYPEPNSGCWLWDAGVSRGGYGVFRLSDVRHSAAAHRVSYEHHIGPIPEGIFVCHRCDVPGCVNPAHLFLGTAHENVVDMIVKGRGLMGGDHHWTRRRPDRIPRGSNCHSTRHSAAVIQEIRRLRTTGLSQDAIAGMVHVSQSQISAILRGKSRSIDQMDTNAVSLLRPR